MQRRRLLRAASTVPVLSATLPLAPRVPVARAQTIEQAIRVVVPNAPGGTSDILARLIAPELGRAFGQTAIVENKPGAGGDIGADAVAKSRPDGATMLLLDVDQMSFLAERCRADPPIRPDRPVRLPGERADRDIARAGRGRAGLVAHRRRPARPRRPPRASGWTRGCWAERAGAGGPRRARGSRARTRAGPLGPPARAALRCRHERRISPVDDPGRVPGVGARAGASV